MSTSSTTANFKGNSLFSSDFSNVISRAVAIASLPITNLQKTQTNLSDQQSALQGLSSQFQALQTSLDALDKATGIGSYSASVDVSSIAGTTMSSGVMAGSYAVTISSIGTHTNTMSKTSLTKVTDPASATFDSAAANFTLSVSGKSYDIKNTGGSLNGLAQAVNASGAPVQATIVNVGSKSSPDYRLSVQGTDYAPDTIQLNDGTKDLLDSIGSPGTYVEYQVNGQPATPIQSTSRSFQISPGLTVDALTIGTVNVTVTKNSYATSSAISSFVNSYNTVVDALGKQRGQNGGALAGNSIVFQLQSTLRSVTNFTANSGALSSLPDVGLTFDKQGHLNFDTSVFSKVSAESLSSFLGGEKTGGFLKTANDVLDGITDSTKGLLPQANKSLSSQISSLTTQISAKQDQVTQLGQNLTAQMAAADATISALEQQVTQITNLFSAMQQSAKSLNG